MSIKIPERPKQPDYTSILKKELSRIGDFSLEDDFNKRMKLERKWDKNEKRGIPYRTKIEGEANVEVSSLNSRLLMKCEYDNYCLELEEYRKELLACKRKIGKIRKQKEQQYQDFESEFKLARTFYDSFQNLAKTKFNYFKDVINTALQKSGENSNIEIIDLESARTNELQEGEKNEQESKS